MSWNFISNTEFTSIDFKASQFKIQHNIGNTAYNRIRTPWKKACSTILSTTFKSVKLHKINKVDTDNTRNF